MFHLKMKMFKEKKYSKTTELHISIQIQEQLRTWNPRPWVRKWRCQELKFILSYQSTSGDSTAGALGSDGPMVP